jgi:hypothetical protein
MNDNLNYRMDRIERLLRELEYEITRGMMEQEIGEAIHFAFTVPVSRSIPGGHVKCEFRTHPLPRDYWNPEDMRHARLLVVGGKKS